MSAPDFEDGKYRSKHCHGCREDAERMKKAMQYDGQYHEPVQQLVCKTCGIRLKWWWFGKLPLTQNEIDTIMKKPIRPGRAF